MSNKKGTGDKDVSGDVLRSLVEDGLRLMADQKLTWNRQVVRGIHWSWNDCLPRKTQKLQSEANIAQSGSAHIQQK